jgi:hypothetical protein
MVGEITAREGETSIYASVTSNPGVWAAKECASDCAARPPGSAYLLIHDTVLVKLT